MESQSLVSGRTSVVHSYASITMPFIVFLVIGATLIVVGILFNSTVLAVLAPIVVMAVYIFIASKETELSKTIVGDSYYYMGFVFTLISLGAALFYLSVNNNVDINTIVGSFGAALVTTVIGLVARLITTSFSYNSTSGRKRAEEKLEKTLATFTVQLEELTSTSINSLTKVQSSVDSTLLKTLESYEVTNKEISEQCEKIINNTQSTIESAVAALAESIGNIDISPELVSAPVSMSLESILETLNSHNKSYVRLTSAMNETNKRLSAQLENSGSIILERADKVENALVGVVEEQMAVYKRSIDQTGKSLVENLGAVAELRDTSEQHLLASLEGLSETVGEVSKALSSANTPLLESSEALSSTTFKMKENMEVFTSMAEVLSNTVNESTKDINVLGSLNKLVPELVKTIEQLNEVLQNTMTKGDQAGVSLGITTKAVEESSKQLASDISKVYGALTEQIQRIGSNA